MTGYAPDAWESFFVANAGAAAALAGLLFVGLSINLETIAASRRLTRRALEAFVLLVGLLVLSVLVLAPGLSTTALGIGVAGAALVVWLTVSTNQVRTITERAAGPPSAEPRASVPVRVALAQVATLTPLIGGATFLAESGGGLYWMVPGVVFTYVAALAGAWVLLIEILR